MIWLTPSVQLFTSFMDDPYFPQKKCIKSFFNSRRKTEFNLTKWYFPPAFYYIFLATVNCTSCSIIQHSAVVWVNRSSRVDFPTRRKKYEACEADRRCCGTMLLLYSSGRTHGQKPLRQFSRCRALVTESVYFML